jgi:hypothetical protein
MVQLVSMIAGQAVREYRVMLGAALTVGVTPVEVKEIVYQAVPYVGMAKVFDFLHATNDVPTAGRNPWERSENAAERAVVQTSVRAPAASGTEPPEPRIHAGERVV